MRHTKHSLLLIFYIFILPYAKSYGFGLQNHRLLTEAAVRLINPYLGKDSITKQQLSWMIEGNLGEDKSFTKALTRTWNQHFYNPEKSEAIQKKYYNKSLVRRFRQRVNEIERAKNSNDKESYILLGGIIHFIQDMGNPAHVVPVYHWHWQPDYFDDQHIIPGIDFPHYLLPQELISLKNIFGYQAALDSAALSTLRHTRTKFIALKDGKQITLDWSAFWQGNPQGWFGEYGYLGHKLRESDYDNYKQEHISIEGSPYKGEYHIPASTYDAFSREQYRNSLYGTIRAILIYKGMNRK